jgi:hypothetical protein
MRFRSFGRSGIGVHRRLSNEKGFIRTVTMIGVGTGADSVRINPVGLNRVARPARRYGDCKAARA